MQTYNYIIADLHIESHINLAEMGVPGFKGFECPAKPAISPNCTLLYSKEIQISNHVLVKEISRFTFAQSDTTCALYRCDNGYLLTLADTQDDEPDKLFHIKLPQHTITTNICSRDIKSIALLKFGLWVMFGIVLCSHDGIAVHSSTIVSNGRGVLFLGESGTGKSTHTRLWRENIEGCTLLNDDSPIVRIIDGEARVYGSPWSGKTPCYKSLSYPIAGICRLSQAPYNKIRRLPTIVALGAILPSCPPAFAHDEILEDAICHTLDTLLSRTPIFHLECLPDADAARLSFNTIIGNE